MIHNIGPQDNTKTQQIHQHTHEHRLPMPTNPQLSSQQPHTFNIQITPAPKKVIRNFHIDYSKKIGQGNYSKVYRAIDQRLPNAPALVVKIIDLEWMRKQNLMNLVMNQVQIMQQIHHDNVIGCRDVILEQNWCYIFMDYCEGGNFQDYIKIYHCLVPESYEVMRYIKEILDGLVYLERKNILHRDIKAANILFKENRAIIADFGFGRYLNNQTAQDISLGSLPYMAPQILKNCLYTNRSDVWSYGILVYQIFHGESPFAKSHNIQQLIEKVHVPLYPSSPLFRKDLSLSIRQLIVTCLRIDYKLRPSFFQIRQMNFFKQFANRKPISYSTYQNNHMKNELIVNSSPTYSVQQIDYSSPLKLPNRLYQTGNYSAEPKIGVVHSVERQIDREERKNLNTNLEPVLLNEYKTNEKNTYRQSSSAQPLSKISFGKAVRIKIPKQNKQGEEIVTNRKKTSEESKGKQRIYAFKQILLQIQESRDYYKLAINLKCTKIKKDEFKSTKMKDEKINKIKERMIIRAYLKICDVESLINDSRVDYGISSPNTRRQKVLSVIKDYKDEFTKQIKRRELEDRNFKLQVVFQQKTPSFIKLSTSKTIEAADIPTDNFDERYQELLETDLKTIEKIELDGNSDRNQQNMEAYHKKIKGLIEDVRSLRKNEKAHRQI